VNDIGFGVTFWISRRGEGDDGLDFGVVGEGLHARRIEAAARRVEPERSLVDTAHVADHVGGVAHEQRRRVDEHTTVLVGLDRQRREHGGWKRVAYVLDQRGVAADRPVTEVLLDDQHPRTRALEVDDARVHDAAVEPHLYRPAAAGGRDVIEDVLVEGGYLHQHPAACLIPVEGHETVGALESAGPVGETGGWRLLGEHLRRAQGENQRNRKTQHGVISIQRRAHTPRLTLVRRDCSPLVTHQPDLFGKGAAHRE
jgi:hypothetical protein